MYDGELESAVSLPFAASHPRILAYSVSLSPSPRTAPIPSQSHAPSTAPGSPRSACSLSRPAPNPIAGPHDLVSLACSIWHSLRACTTVNRTPVNRLAGHSPTNRPSNHSRSLARFLAPPSPIPSHPIPSQSSSSLLPSSSSSLSSCLSFRLPYDFTSITTQLHHQERCSSLIAAPDDPSAAISVFRPATAPSTDSPRPPPSSPQQLRAAASPVQPIPSLDRPRESVRELDQTPSSFAAGRRKQEIDTARGLRDN